MDGNNPGSLRVFLDTNVFVSAIYGGHSCLQCLHFIENSCELILCTSVINEFFEVLRLDYRGTLFLMWLINIPGQL